MFKLFLKEIYIQKRLQLIPMSFLAISFPFGRGLLEDMRGMYANSRNIVKYSIEVHIRDCIIIQGFGSEMCNNISECIITFWILQEGSDSIHQSLVSSTWKTKKNITTLIWPAQSSGVNTIQKQLPAGKTGPYL